MLAVSSAGDECPHMTSLRGLGFSQCGGLRVVPLLMTTVFLQAVALLLMLLVRAVLEPAQIQGGRNTDSPS